MQLLTLAMRTRMLSIVAGAFGDSYSVPCKGAVLQWVKFPSGNWSLQPVAIEAGKEGNDFR